LAPVKFFVSKLLPKLIHKICPQVTATVQLQRTATGPGLINTAVENAKMAEKQIRRARAAYIGLFLLMVKTRTSICSVVEQS
jgi:hypothetical protein